MKSPDIQRYVAVAADETRSIVVMCGGQNGGVILVNSGPLYTPRDDVRRLWGCWALTLRAGAVVPGVALSIVGLTGMTGDLWLYQLDTGLQGAGQLVTLRQTPTTVNHGVGVLLISGALRAGDIVQIGAVYD